VSVGAVSHAIPQYRVPATPNAKEQDERTESIAIKQREADTGKDVAVPVSNSSGGVDTQA